MHPKFCKHERTNSRSNVYHVSKMYYLKSQKNIRLWDWAISPKGNIDINFIKYLDNS